LRPFIVILSVGAQSAPKSKDRRSHHSSPQRHFSFPVITEFAGPTPSSGAAGFALGPDQAVWYTEWNADKIGRITTAGSISEFPIPTPGSNPDGIVTGADGNIWFNEGAADKIARVTPTGTFTEFPVPTGGAQPSQGITVGPDKSIWFCEFFGNNIGRLQW